MWAASEPKFQGMETRLTVLEMESGENIEGQDLILTEVEVVRAQWKDLNEEQF